jgi:signal transduction histidine kinase
MRSLFLKILFSSFLTAIITGLAMAVPITAMLIPGTSRLAEAVPVAAALAVGAAGLICYGLSRHITTPLVELRGNTASIAAGHLSVRVSPGLRSRKDEIGCLGRDFDRMAERLESLVSSQQRLLRNISHELRSPLARLSVALGLARQTAAAERTDFLDRITLEADRLDRLVGQLLTLARLEDGDGLSTLSPVELTTLVQQIADDADFEARGQSRRVTASTSESCRVAGSEDLLRSAVENVVRNAVRHTAENTTVTVLVCLEGGQALVRVQDRGPGVPDAMLSDMFRPFHRGPAAQHSGGTSTGLGLAIAERAIVAHGGSIVARNAPDGGLTVDIRLSVVHEGQATF